MRPSGGVKIAAAAQPPQRRGRQPCAPLSPICCGDPRPDDNLAGRAQHGDVEAPPCCRGTRLRVKPLSNLDARLRVTPWRTSVQNAVPAPSILEQLGRNAERGVVSSRRCQTAGDTRRVGPSAKAGLETGAHRMRLCRADCATLAPLEPALREHGGAHVLRCTSKLFVVRDIRLEAVAAHCYWEIDDVSRLAQGPLNRLAAHRRSTQQTFCSEQTTERIV